MIEEGRVRRQVKMKLKSDFIFRPTPEPGVRSALGPSMRFKLSIEYAGTRYSGWQIQKNARTVQGELQRAIEAATGQRRFELYGSGRTDAGVHALLQVAHL